ncbi:hypothetical protein ACK868_004937, partial [Salmonella enterica]
TVSNTQLFSAVSYTRAALSSQMSSYLCQRHAVAVSPNKCILFRCELVTFMTQASFTLKTDCPELDGGFSAPKLCGYFAKSMI